jgi:uncharacterized repeat protein (TIGR01451 family)
MKYSRALVATLLVGGSLSQFVPSVSAEGTAAGTAIENTATASYDDPTAPGTVINTTSNKVIVTVAEVAGITVTGSGVTPGNVGFFNTVQNTGTTTSNISLLPELLTSGSLPENTKVRIHTAAGQSATYEVIGNAFVFVAGSGVGNSGGVAISATNPVILENVASNGTALYQVEVDLPTGTALSTDTSKGFPVVINAFIAGSPTATNKTIDRVYTGFVKLVKETRILQGSGPTVAPADVAFSLANKNPATGNIIEYRITYTNISEAQVGAGNAILKAANLAIVEDGTSTNTWAKDGDTNGIIDTSNVVSSAVNLGTTANIELYKGANGLTSTIDQSGKTADAAAQKPIVLKLSQAKKVTDKQGFKLVPIAKAQPGDVIVYTIAANNISIKPVNKLVLNQKIRPGTTYVLNSATPSKDATLTFSTDGGKSFVPQPMLGKKPAPASSYTNVRWAFTNSIAPKSQSTLSYEVRVR